MTRFGPIHDIDGYGLMASPHHIDSLTHMDGWNHQERRLKRKGYRSWVIIGGWKHASKATVWDIRDRLAKLEAKDKPA